jgi:DNA ligase D-like protein (predicted 3'-phosphoesterase)
MAQDKLKAYKRKRSQGKTPEPFQSGGKSKGGRVFVVQKHAASSLHYDFRIEIDGVLKSWAVPKGPSLNPKDKRLAMATEDHPLSYKDFEGVIPEGEYGGGTVIVWDAGTYKNTKRKDGKLLSMEKSYDAGQVEIELHGKKLTGGYALIRTGKPGDKRWLLIKRRDDHADERRNPVSTEPKSVLSGLTIDQMRKKMK